MINVYMHPSRMSLQRRKDFDVEIMLQFRWALFNLCQSIAVMLRQAEKWIVILFNARMGFFFYIYFKTFDYVNTMEMIIYIFPFSLEFFYND